jgi:hypothetical protein
MTEANDSLVKNLFMMETKNMQTAKTFYDGVALFQIETPSVPKEKEADLTVSGENRISPKVAKKLALLAVINSNLERLNRAEPLLPEFDEILARRVNFSERPGF